MSPILVIADDLSGAAELAAVAADRGLTASVQRHTDCTIAAEVTAIDTDSRSSPAGLVHLQMREIAEHLARYEGARIFKKVDSLLRGQPRAEIETLMQALGCERSILIPANPSRGRTVSGGRYFVHGEALDQTVFAHDPEFPRTASCFSSLIPPGSLPIANVSRPASLVAKGITIPDVESADDVRHWAATVERSVLPAGAADFFVAMLDHWCGPALRQVVSDLPQLKLPALLVCGSHAAWQSRKHECSRAQLVVIEVGAASIAGACHIDSFAAAAEVMRSQRRLVLSSGEALIPLQERAARLESLAHTAALLVRQEKPASLLLEGGATAAAVVSHLGWNRFAVEPSGAHGVGFLRPIGEANAPLVAVKPGSYPWPPEIWQSFCR